MICSTLAYCHFCRRIIGEGSNWEQAEAHAIHEKRAKLCECGALGERLICCRCIRAMKKLGTAPRSKHKE